MAFEMLRNAGPGVTGSYVDFHSCGRNPVSLRCIATGTFAAGNVVFEHSPNSGQDWLTLGTVTSGNELAVERPVDWVRARTDAAVAGGTANAYIEASA